MTSTSSFPSTFSPSLSFRSGLSRPAFFLFVVVFAMRKETRQVLAQLSMLTYWEEITHAPTCRPHLIIQVVVRVDS